MLGLIHRSFSVSCPTTARRKLYISLVRSQLLYCFQIWRPSLIKHINTLERIQRRATKSILNDFYSTYKSRLVTLNMLTLMYIYETNDIMFFIKSYKTPTSHFNINNYLQFSTSNSYQIWLFCKVGSPQVFYKLSSKLLLSPHTQPVELSGFNCINKNYQTQIIYLHVETLFTRIQRQQCSYLPLPLSLQLLCKNDKISTLRQANIIKYSST